MRQATCFLIWKGRHWLSMSQEPPWRGSIGFNNSQEPSPLLQACEPVTGALETQRWLQECEAHWRRITEVSLQVPSDSVALWDPSRHSSMCPHLIWWHYWWSGKRYHCPCHQPPSGNWACLVCNCWPNHKWSVSGAPLLFVDTSAQWHSWRLLRRSGNWCALFYLIFGWKRVGLGVFSCWCLHLQSKKRNQRHHTVETAQRKWKAKKE